MDDEYSFDFGSTKAVNGSNGNNSLVNETENADKVPNGADKMPISADKMPESSLSTQQKLVLQFVTENGQITSHQAESLLGVKQRRARAILGGMVDQGVLERHGSYKSTVYVIKERR